MKIRLSPVQLNVLRRCSKGLRVFEVGVDHAELIAQLGSLRGLKLVAHDEATGYATTPAGEAWLDRYDD